MSKKVAVKRVRCIECRCAYLMRSRKTNPIVADCRCVRRNNMRAVAESLTECEFFEPYAGDYKSRQIHSMVKLDNRYNWYK